MLITCDDCQNEKFKINFAPPMELTVICINCGKEQLIGENAK